MSNTDSIKPGPGPHKVAPPTPEFTDKRFTFEVDLARAVWLCKAVLAAVSPDDITPVITASQWTVADKVLTAVSTDRYRVHRARVDLEKSQRPPAQFLMPGDAMRWILRSQNQFGSLRKAGVTNTLRVVVTPGEMHEATLDPKTLRTRPAWQDAATVTVTIIEAGGSSGRQTSLTTSSVRGIFPPVARLIDQATFATEAQAFSLKPSFVAASQVLASDSYETPKFQQTMSGNPDKPGPMLLSFAHGEALIQPNLMLR